MSINNETLREIRDALQKHNSYMDQIEKSVHRIVLAIIFAIATGFTYTFLNDIINRMIEK